MADTGNTGSGASATLSRADEVKTLLDRISAQTHAFIADADADAFALASGHGLEKAGTGPRTVLVEHHPPHKLASLLELSVSPSNPPGSEGGIEDFARAAQKIFDYSVNTSSPGFMDKLYAAPSPAALAGDLLLSSLNTNSHVYAVSPALTLIEKFVGRELARLFGLVDAQAKSSSPHAGGVTVPGGAAANTIAMQVARNVRFPRVKEDGLAALPAKLAIFASASAHYSGTTAAQALGLGSKAVRKVATRGDDSMDPAALEKELQAAKDAGEVPFFVMGTAGTTVRGAYDDLKALGELSRKYGAWYHIDACWGGGAVFSEKLKYKLAGSELADSISYNPHKMIGVGTTCSFLIAKDLRMLWTANRLEAGYLFHGDSEQADANGIDAGKDGRAQTDSKGHDGLNENWRESPWVKGAPRADEVHDLAQFVPQCGRRPDAVKLYMHWRYYGTEGIAAHVESSFAGAGHVMRLVKESAVLKAVSDEEEPPCAQACFYYVGNKGSIGMSKQVTRAIVAKLANRGWMTDFAPGKDKEEEYIRAVCNRQTTERIAEGLVKAVTKAGEEVEQELKL